MPGLAQMPGVPVIVVVVVVITLDREHYETMSVPCLNTLMTGFGTESII